MKKEHGTLFIKENNFLIDQRFNLKVKFEVFLYL